MRRLLGLAAAALLLASCGGAADRLVVYVGYADSSGGAVPHGFPSPWMGAPHVRFVGSGGPYDAGAIRIDNPTGHPVTLDGVRVTAGGREWSMWGRQRIEPHSTLILTQTRGPGSFATTQAAGAPCLDPGNAVPVVALTLDGRTLRMRDMDRVLTTGGRDLGACPGNPNKSRPWTSLGTVSPGTAAASASVSPAAAAQVAGIAVAGVPLLLGLLVAVSVALSALVARAFQIGASRARPV
jgi:hypothetical protein